MANKVRNADNGIQSNNDHEWGSQDMSFSYCPETVSPSSSNCSLSSSHQPNPSEANNDELSDKQFIDQFSKYIDPDLPDPFDPEHFDEDSMRFISPDRKNIGHIPDNILARLDLLRILNRAGCSLQMYDTIIRWVVHYSQKDHPINIWTDYPIKSRKTFISNLSEIFGTACQKPLIRKVNFPFDNRIVSIPTFSFIHGVLSLLNDSSAMAKENIIDKYNIHTGKCGNHFWDPKSIPKIGAGHLPKPIDPKRKIGDITTSCLFQSSVARFCTKPHHMPVPLVFFLRQR